MKEISFRAKAHPWLARIMIVCIHLLLFAGAAYIGNTLKQLDVQLSLYILIAGILLLAAGVIIYFCNKFSKQSKHIKYGIHKSCDMFIGVATFICFTFLFNDSKSITYLNASYLSKASFVTEKKAEKESSVTSQPLSRKELKKELKELKSELKEGEKGNAGKVIGIVLVILGGIVLLALLAALSCSIACAGSGALAIITLLAGITGIVFLLLWALRKISDKHKKIQPVQKAS